MPTRALRALADEPEPDAPVVNDTLIPAPEEDTGSKADASPASEQETPTDHASEQAAPTDPAPTAEPAPAAAPVPDADPEGPALTAQAADTTPPVLTHVYLLDANGAPIKDGANVDIDLASGDALPPVTTDAKRIRVVVSDEHLSTYAAASYVAPYDDTTGTSLEATAFTRVGETSDYEAILDGSVGIAPDATLPEGSLGLLVVAQDTSGNQLASSGDAYVLIGATLADPTQPLSDANQPKATGELVIDHAPQVTVTVRTPATPADTYGTVAFYAQDVTVEVTVADATLHQDTTIAGAKLSGFPMPGTSLAAGVVVTARSAYTAGVSTEFTATLVLTASPGRDAAHETSRALTVLDALDDGFELADDATVTITDFAGNTCGFV